MSSKIQPKPTATSEPYWQGAQEHLLRLQRCTQCEKTQFYPRIICSHCQSSDLEWVNACGHGKVASFTVVRRGVSDAYPTPYVVALIDLAEGPRMMSHIIDADLESIQVGADVTVDFVDWSDEVVMPVFTLSREADHAD